MKPILPIKALAAIGLVLLSSSFIVKHYCPLADFSDGFLKGLGIGIILLSLIREWYLKQSRN